MKISLAVTSFVLSTSTGALAFISNTAGSKACFISSTIPSSPTILYGTPGMDLSGNSWKPDSGKMGSTDTGDFFPEDYDPDAQPGYMDGMMGSQQMLSGGNRSGPQLPGMENLGADAIMMGGIEENSEIPAGMEFIPSSVPDGSYEFQVAASSNGGQIQIEIKPFCMGFEDYYAAFTKESHSSLKVSPCAGRMDRRGGESTFLTVSCTPNGQAGTFSGDLVVNLPEDMSKLTYKISVTSF